MTPLALISSIVLGFLTLIGGAFGAWLKFRTDKQASVSADWHSFTTEIRQQLNDQKKEIISLKDRIEQLETQVTKWKNRYWAAIDHIRDLRLTHDNPPELPKIIAHDLEQAT